MNAILLFLLVGPQDGTDAVEAARQAVELAKARDPEAKVRAFIKAGETRLTKLKKEKKGKRAEKLASSYEKLMVEGAEVVIKKGNSAGKDVSGAAKAYEDATGKHLEVLQRVLQKVPEQAKKGIQRALEVSRRGHERSKAAPGYNKPKKVPPGQAKKDGKPDKGKPKDKPDKGKPKDKPDKGKPKDKPDKGKPKDKPGKGKPKDKEKDPPGKEKKKDKPDKGKKGKGKKP